MPNRLTMIRALVASILLAAVALTAGPAQATPVGGDDCYPDGCEPPTEPPPREEATCAMSATSAESGDAVTVTVANVVPGSLVRLLFDGEEVGQETAGPPASDAEATVSVDIAFVVPDVPPGSHTVVAVGDSFSATCSSGGVAGIQVLRGAGGTGGSLPRTGAYVAAFVAVALALLGVGWWLVRGSRSRSGGPGQHAKA